jgi:hypothetical protein
MYKDMGIHGTGDEIEPFVSEALKVPSGVSLEIQLIFFLEVEN